MINIVCVCVCDFNSSYLEAILVPTFEWVVQLFSSHQSGKKVLKKHKLMNIFDTFERFRESRRHNCEYLRVYGRSSQDIKLYQPTTGDWRSRQNNYHNVLN